MNGNPSNLILLVEDDPDIATLLGAVLRRADFEHCWAATAQTGWQLALERSPAAVVLDIDLPDFSGIELCRRLKADSRTANLPVIFCSGCAEARHHALAAGGLDFLDKPDGIFDLPERLRKVLHR